MVRDNQSADCHTRGCNKLRQNPILSQLESLDFLLEGLQIQLWLEKIKKLSYNNQESSLTIIRGKIRESLAYITDTIHQCTSTKEQV